VVEKAVALMPAERFPDLNQFAAALRKVFGRAPRETYPRQELVDLVSQAGLATVEFYDDTETQGDALDLQTLQQIDPVIDRYITRSVGLPEQDALQARGEELRQRLHNVGFLSASSLLAWGVKA